MAKAKRAAPGKRRWGKTAEVYKHPDQTVLMRPEVGTQAQFRKKKPPVTYRYDSSLSPALDWDGQNAAREAGEAAIKDVQQGASNLSRALEQLKSAGAPVPVEIERTARQALAKVAQGAGTLQRLSRPFLNWAGKAERLSFDVPTLPLFVHERLSTKAIVETLVSHKADKQVDMFDLFGDPHHSVTDQVLRAYEHADKWVNRLILGDSLVVMNSLLHYERLGGQMQMIYIDPPYGVKFGSNFQPFVRKRDVSHGDDEDLTREPEMVKAYRDTWELGLHTYLTYMRDRLLLARELLTQSGSVFVQISDENVHHVRELMDEVFGPKNFVNQVTFVRGGSQTGDAGLPSNCDYLLWFAKDIDSVKHRPALVPDGGWAARALDLWEELADGTRQRISDVAQLSQGARAFTHRSMESARTTGSQLNQFEIEFEGRLFRPKRGWSTTPQGVDELKRNRRLMIRGDGLRFITYLDDFPFSILTANWTDTGTGSFTEEKLYVVQTSVKVLQRCLLMTTDPGDLVLDPTCGSGTTAYVAEQWGRRWITIDTSRVPLALGRQRLLTATFSYYELKESGRGPAGGFVYKRRRNNKGDEIGGIVPHVTLKSIANNDPPEEEILSDRPEVDSQFVRVTGPFVVEATIPTPVDWEGDGVEDSGAEALQSYGSFVERMVEILRRSPVLHVGGGKTVELGNIRPPAKSLSLSAEGVAVNGEPRPVAFVFGPESGAVSEKLVHEALKEASLKQYTHLYVIGFSIQPHARQLVDNAADMGLLPATYVQATPDLMMGDLLKNMRSSQIFSVCGLPEVKIQNAKPALPDGAPRFEVELIGLDTFDPTTMQTDHRAGGDVPCWLLDSDYNNLCFRATQVFFPRTGAWESLKKALKADYDETVWDHLAGTRSAPFEGGEHKQVAVKVIDDRGNELLVVKELK
jgi:adenine-specific DNA-methyltransferase